MLAVFLVIIGVVMRLLPHLPNFAPIAAVALFGSVYLPKRIALVLPVTALVISDFLIGFDSLQGRLTVYGSFLLIGLIGFVVRTKKSLWCVAAGSLAGSVVFYLITNFVFFYPEGMYSHDFSGAMSSYINAWPFFWNTVVGDLFYVGMFFGLYEGIMLYKEKTHPKASMI